MGSEATHDPLLRKLFGRIIDKYHLYFKNIHR